LVQQSVQSDQYKLAFLLYKAVENGNFANLAAPPQLYLYVNFTYIDCVFGEGGYDRKRRKNI
jgi:hypothetical protein